ncbi:MAG: hypothetical protein PUC44_07910 [Eubacteriales bacterium]|nr:hypothetical protein [Eubacteriales bacterium]
MIVYSLTGKSGTGKSYQAKNLCRKLGIETMIDDGLLIHKNKIVAGHSAKLEKTKLGAIRAAVLSREDHRREIAEKLKGIHPEKLLILGTSDGMTEKIAEQLNLPKISEYIHIEDITTEKEREAARESRDVLGKHVIPVPTMELKRDFAGYFMDPMKLFRDRKNGYESEKTVVRPAYSYMGDFVISDSVLRDIAVLVGEETPGVARVQKVYENTVTEELCLTVFLTMTREVNLWEGASAFQHALMRMIERMTAFNVAKIDVQIRGIEDAEI